ncbi:geranylgeranylglyceryl/heptaprenylglyceryl phosphate synthase [Candidatus Poribacteria bacterium]|nr:geranylgeranylglyceryl/heptaprenylglyceryl phosphate synthase [Candidatus Poribacteria bacterium]
MASRCILKYLHKVLEKQNAGYIVLIDPEGCEVEKCAKLACEVERAGADAILLGGSLLTTDLHPIAATLKSETAIPIILFPGDSMHLTPHADAILYMSLISGRNPNYLIGEQVKAAPWIQRYGLQPIPTGYMLIEGGNRTAVEFMSGTVPIPRDKPDIAGPHALAAQYLGMRLVYLEAGSGAEFPVPNIMISSVKAQIEIPLIVGGGIRTPEIAAEKVNAGADFIVTGNILEKSGSFELMKQFADAVHG